MFTKATLITKIKRAYKARNDASTVDFLKGALLAVCTLLVLLPTLLVVNAARDGELRLKAEQAKNYLMESEYTKAIGKVLKRQK